jgi:hypothetical protein
MAHSRLFFIFFLLVLSSSWAYSKPFATFLMPLKYIYREQTHDRILPDKRVQRLHASSDYHVGVSWEKEQVRDMVEHIKQHPQLKSRVINETHTPENMPVANEKQPNSLFEKTKDFVRARWHALLNFFHAPTETPTTHATGNSTQRDAEFLRTIHAACLQESIPTQSIEFRAIIDPILSNLSPNTTKLETALTHIEKYVEDFKKDSIAKGILTEQDFDSVPILKQKLAPFKHKTIHELRQGKKLGDHAPGSPPRLLYDVTNTLIDNRASYEICKDQEHDDLYLNVGGAHLDNIRMRLSRHGWIPVAEEGVATEKAKKEHKNNKALTSVNLAEYFKNLPPRQAILKKDRVMSRLFARVKSILAYQPYQN